MSGKCFVLAIGTVLGLLGQSAGATDRLSLTRRQAIQMALEADGSFQVQLADESREEATARVALARAPLLPQLDAGLVQRRQTINLEALGIQSQGFFRPPKLVGPFGNFDARAGVQQQVFNLASIRRYRSSKTGLEAAEIQAEAVRDEVAFAVGLAYLQAQRARAAVSVGEADVRLAGDLLELAQHQKEIGTGTRIEVTRAEVQLADREQQLATARTEFKNALIQLARAIGLDMGLEIELVDSLEYRSVQPPALDDAVREALLSRADYLAQMQREESARQNYEASRAVRWPSVAVFADYGSSGAAPDNSIPTWQAGLKLEIPVYDGGAMDAARAEALSLWRQESIRTEDFRQAVEMEVRLALGALRLAEESVRVAEKGIELAGQELEQARRRYSAGVTTSLEVTDSQSRLERARQNRLAALFNHSAARLALEDAVGRLRPGREP